jgi:hypothetical protein
MRSLFNSVLLGSTLVIVLASRSSASAEAAKSAVAIDPIQGIVSQFKTHSVVALGDGYFMANRIVTSSACRSSTIHGSKLRSTTLFSRPITPDIRAWPTAHWSGDEINSMLIVAGAHRAHRVRTGHGGGPRWEK